MLGHGLRERLRKTLLAGVQVTLRYQMPVRLLPVIDLMNRLEREFAMEGETMQANEFLPPEEVCILVGRGRVAQTLREIGLEIHKTLVKEKEDGNQN